MKVHFAIFLHVALLLASGCSRSGMIRHDGVCSTWPDLTSAKVDYGFTDDRLHFVVFQNEQSAETEPRAKLSFVLQPEGYNACTGYIDLPDGTKPDLATSNRIYEFTSGKFVSAPIDFTRTQLQAYLRSRPKPPTLHGLKSFLSK